MQCRSAWHDSNDATKLALRVMTERRESTTGPRRRNSVELWQGTDVVSASPRSAQRGGSASYNGNSEGGGGGDRMGGDAVDDDTESSAKQIFSRCRYSKLAESFIAQPEFMLSTIPNLAENIRLNSVAHATTDIRHSVHSIGRHMRKQSKVLTKQELHLLVMLVKGTRFARHFLVGWSNEARMELLRGCKFMRLRKDQCAFREGDANTLKSLLVVVTGTVQLAVRLFYYCSTESIPPTYFILLRSTESSYPLRIDVWSAATLSRLSRR